MQKRNLEELNLLDDFLMGSVLSYPGIGPEVCRRMVSIILNREIKQIRIIPQNAKDADLMAIHQMVQKVKHDREVSLEYMKIFERERLIREDGYASGKEDGYASGKEDGYVSGKEAGKEAELVEIIRRKQQKGLSADDIAEWLELDKEYVEKVMKLLEENPDADDMAILAMV